MRFYEIKGKTRKINHSYNKDRYSSIDDYIKRSFDFERELFSKTRAFNEGSNLNLFITVSQVNSSEIVLCALTEEPVNLINESKKLLDAIHISASCLYEEEITFAQFYCRLSNADRNNYIEDCDNVYRRFNLRYFCFKSCRELEFEEDLVNLMPKRREEALRKSLLTSDDLLEEFGRIETCAQIEGISGHPVHYIIKTDDKSTLINTTNLLLGSLLKARRIHSKRVSVIDCSISRRRMKSLTESLFTMNKGGVVVATFNKVELFESDRATRTLENLEIFCDCMKAYRNEVLVVLHFEHNCTQLRNFLFEKLGNLSFVEIAEQPADAVRAKSLLRLMAKKKNVSSDKVLFSKIEADKTYTTKELRLMFEEWYSKILRTTVYPQYAQFKALKIEAAKEGVQGSAYEELTSMIGLTEPKKIIEQAIDFHKMQKFLATQDMHRERPSQHMIFTGNPGTAKTTVARLFARIMRENELLSSGHIVEVGRGDLVGKYVGHTAPLVQKCFSRAKGGVLFIDEAYSLVDDRDGCFGDEAINTIVQEMENNRDDVVVIFAGYPDKMEQFLTKNPGLRSRIAFHVSFPDYTTEELCEIATALTSKKELLISEDAREKLRNIFDRARENEDFGNGRFVRSAIEKATMAQSSRIVKLNLESLTKTELTTLCAEDFEGISPSVQTKLKLGFCA